MNNETLKYLLKKTNEYAEKLKEQNFFGNAVSKEDELYKEKFGHLKNLK